MKRILPVLLGALAGAIGLPILMYVCAEVARLLLRPPFFGGRWPQGTYHFFGALTVSIGGRTHLLFDGRIIPISGVLLGAWSVILWSGKRTFWSRFTGASCSAAVCSFLAWTLQETNQIYGLSIRSFFWMLLAFYLPLLLWALGLFFFAVLTRKRKPLLS